MTGVVPLIVFFGLLPLGVGALLRRWLLYRHGVPMGKALREGRVVTYSHGLVAVSILLGGLGGAVFGIALPPSTTDLVATVWGVEPSPWIAGAVAGPLAEELGKLLPLLFLFLFRRIRTSMDGMMLGLAAGLGFACIENMIWFTVTHANEGTDAMIASMRVRVVFGSLIHGTASSLGGAYLGGALANGRRGVVFLAPLAALAASTGVHGAWNGLLLLADEERVTPVVIALLVVLVALAAVVLLARHELWRAGFARRTMVPRVLRSGRYERVPDVAPPEEGPRR